jgi:hypothetical protein
MENKKFILIRFFGFAILCEGIIITSCYLNYFIRNAPIQAPKQVSHMPEYFIGILYAILCLLSGIGILKFKEWGRKTLFALIGYSIVYVVGKCIFAGSPLNTSTVVWLDIYFAFILYFNCPLVKRQFKGSEGDLTNHVEIRTAEKPGGKRSFGTLIFGGMNLGLGLAGIRLLTEPIIHYFDLHDNMAKIAALYGPKIMGGIFLCALVPGIGILLSKHWAPKLTRQVSIIMSCAFSILIFLVLVISIEKNVLFEVLSPTLLYWFVVMVYCIGNIDYFNQLSVKEQFK